MCGSRRRHPHFLLANRTGWREQSLRLGAAGTAGTIHSAFPASQFSVHVERAVLGTTRWLAGTCAHGTRFPLSPRPWTGWAVTLAPGLGSRTSGGCLRDSQGCQEPLLPPPGPGRAAGAPGRSHSSLPLSRGRRPSWTAPHGPLGRTPSQGRSGGKVSRGPPAPQQAGKGEASERVSDVGCPRVGNRC